VCFVPAPIWFILVFTGSNLTSSDLYLNVVHFFNTSVIYRHLWQLKTVLFLALVSNMCLFY